MGCSENIAFYLSCPWLRPGLKLLADVAYVRDERCVCPYKKPELTAEAAGSVREAAKRRRYNQRLSACRIKVEHAFSRLKHTFRLLQSTWQLPNAQLPRTFRAACLLCNWLSRTRRLYNIHDVLYELEGTEAVILHRCKPSILLQNIEAACVEQFRGKASQQSPRRRLS